MPSKIQDDDSELSDFDSGIQERPSRQKLVNQHMLRQIRLAIEADPEVDILSVIPKSYSSKMQNSKRPISDVARLNLSTIDAIQLLVATAPEINLLSNFPASYGSDYARQIEGINPTYVKADKPAKAPPPPVDTLTRLAPMNTAKLLFPLSRHVENLMIHPDKDSSSLFEPQALARALKTLLQKSEKLWEHQLRGAVYKCSTEIAVKVIRCDEETTEYTSMQYLQQHAPAIPAPRPHGLIRVGYFSAIFMSYIPSMTLETAWPSLSQEQKLDVQHQLNDIMTQLRQLKRPAHLPMGGVGGEGVKDLHREEFHSRRIIDSIAVFEDFKFSLSKLASASYVRFLKTLLPPRVQKSVFSHGDLRPANIMVELDAHGHCVVNGIIDWENSGFYPDFHEATKCTNMLHPGKEDDWYQYIPQCIAPSAFPQWWLVDRLWDRNITHDL